MHFAASICGMALSSLVIASRGHFMTHKPHLMQVSSLMTATPICVLCFWARVTFLIAPDGHILKSWVGYGPGLLKDQLRRWMRPQPQTVYGTHNGNPMVDYPTYGSSNADALQITQVERTDSATILRIHAYYIPKYWIQLAKETHLVADDGTKCPVLRTEGLSLGEQFYMPESGEADFTLYFAPLPASAKTFDFTEGNGEGAWQINGIRVVK